MSEVDSLLRFWQRIIGSELPPDKIWPLWNDLASSDNREERLLSHSSLSAAERLRIQRPITAEAESAMRSGIRVVPHDEYPQQFQSVRTKLPALFARGEWAVTHRPAVGIVGTRSASAYGRAVAHKFAEAFARAGITVVSGGALGIDAAAHKGAIAAGGATVAVLAGGVDVIYPRVHAGLFSEITQNGCLVSQFAVGAKPWQHLFLVRNRLVAALSQAILVVEAPARSGALSTAGAANDLGRDVYVVPANIDNENFRGSHALLRDGAILVDHPDQVLEGLGIAAPDAAQFTPNVSEIGARIVSILSIEPLSAERISEQTGVPAAIVLSELTTLEMDGLVQRTGRGYAVRL